MTQTNNDIGNDELALSEFRQALDGWRGALEAHRMAPPDEDFSLRLVGLAEAASEQARACQAANAAGFDWPPHRAAESRPPYELQPGTGRRGPKDLWRRFDGAVASLNAVATGRDILAVARAFEELAAASEKLAKATEHERRVSERPAVADSCEPLGLA
jgi:hypothetical protein